MTAAQLDALAVKAARIAARTPGAATREWAAADRWAALAEQARHTKEN
jgi:hypothetical protein